MARLRYLFLCSVAAKAISAACSADRTFIIRNATDASALASCPTYTGNIAVSIKASGVIDVPKLQILNGDLIIYDNLALSALRAESLSRIKGKLIVRNVQNLSLLAFPKLSQVTDLVLDSLPKLAELGMDIQNASNIFIGNNRILGNITLHLKEVQQSFTVVKNGNGLKGVSLPDLTAIERDVVVGCNSKLAELAAPSLDHVGKSINIQANPVMTTLRLPELESVKGGLWNFSSPDTPKLPALGVVENAPYPGHINCTLQTITILPTLYYSYNLDSLSTGSIEMADSDARMPLANPEMTNPNSDSDLQSSTNTDPIENASTRTNTNPPISTSLSTRTKAIVAVTIVVGIVIAAAIALCRFMVKRKLKKSRTKEEDEEGVMVSEEDCVAKDGSRMVSTSIANSSLETTALRMISLGLSEMPKPLRSHKSTTFRPIKLATPIKLAPPDALGTVSSTLPVPLVATQPGGNTSSKEVQDRDNVQDEADRRSRLGQDLDRAHTAHDALERIEFTNPFKHTNSLNTPKPNDRESILPSPTTKIPQLTRKQTTLFQPPKLHLDTQSASLDSRCLSVSSQPPRLELNLGRSSASSSQTSLAEGTADCAIAESSSIQRLKPAVVHVRTPSPRTSGGFGAQYGCDPRLSRVMAEAGRRTSSV